MNDLTRLLTYTKRYWKLLLFSGVASTLYGIFSAAPSYFIQHVIDAAILTNRSNLLFPFVLCFIGLFIIKGIFMFISGYYMDWVGNRVVNDLRIDLFAKIIHLPISFFQQKTTGELMSHFLNDITLIQNAASAAVRNGLRSLFEALFLFSVAFLQNWPLALLLLLVGPFIGIAMRKMGTFMRSSSQFSQQQMGNVSSILQEQFIGIREIKSFNSEETEIRRFSMYINHYFTSIMKNVRMIALAPACIEIISMSGTALVFYAAVKQVMSGVITPGQLASFFAAILLAYQPLKRLINVYADMQTGLTAARRIFALMDQAIPLKQMRHHTLSSFNNAIQFQEVSFAYTTENPIFSQVTLTISKGESIGLLGPSGFGKSTFCDLLLGFITPTKGTIYIDNHDITSVSFTSLRNNIGYVSQQTFLFNDTIYANIAYGKPSASNHEVIATCKAAHAHDFIETLPNGYQTLVGENGILLSGGQKQRLTIARALLKKPAILIFDEATSALDAKSETIIQQALEEIRRYTTVIIISHRLSLIEKMDRIFTIQNQSIVELSKQSLKQNLEKETT